MSDYVPAAGFAALTRFYDLGVRLTMREHLWRPLLIDAVGATSPGVVVDIGCGTGSLSIPLAAVHPETRVIGIDGDREVLALARRKPGADRVRWVEGVADALPVGDDTVDVVVSTLVLHHLPLDVKRAMLAETHRVLRPGAHLLIADWGRPSDPVANAGFRALQLLDGFATTEDNRRGMVPTLIGEAGFGEPRRLRRLRTVLGTFEVLSAQR